MPALISLAQARRFRGADAPFAHWSHCALVVDTEGGLVEAESRGVQRSPMSKYRNREYHLVSLGDDFPDAARERAVSYAGRQVGSAFGYLVLFSAAVWLLLGLRLKLGRADHQICSGLVARALREGGILTSEDPRFILPADLAKRYAIRP